MKRLPNRKRESSLCLLRIGNGQGGSKSDGASPETAMCYPLTPDYTMNAEISNSVKEISQRGRSQEGISAIGRNYPTPSQTYPVAHDAIFDTQDTALGRAAEWKRGGSR